MITKEIEGDIWATDCQVIVIPTNCVGVMGKGLAKQLKERHPHVYLVYKYLYNRNQLRIDRPDLIRDAVNLDKLFLLFPTKKHWRDPSELLWVQENLKWITRNHPEGDLQGLTSIAIPPLGCGLGGLPYEAVKALMIEHLSSVEFDVHLYLPTYTPLGTSLETEADPWPTPIW